MASDSFVGDGLVDSPYYKLLKENKMLKEYISKLEDKLNTSEFEMSKIIQHLKKLDSK